MLVLQEKVAVLEGNQRERRDKMVSMEGELERTLRELESAVTENSALLERVGEMATASVTLAETSAELERVRGELAAEVKGREGGGGGEGQAVGRYFGGHEVETHTVGVAPESPRPPGRRGTGRKRRR